MGYNASFFFSFFSSLVLEPASISRGLQNQLVSWGKSLHLSCEIHGNPLPTVTWYHNGIPVHLSSRHLPSGNKLRINQIVPEDTGLYQCLVNNGIGFSQSTGRFHSQTGKKHMIHFFLSSFNLYKNGFVGFVGYF